MRVDGFQHRRHLFPSAPSEGATNHHHMIHQPALPMPPPTPHKHFHAARAALHIHPGGQFQAARRQGARCPGFAAVIKALPFRRFTGDAPGAAKLLLGEGFQAFWVILNFFEFRRQVAPGQCWRIQRIDLIAGMFRDQFRLCMHPFACRQHRRAGGWFNPRAAFAAMVQCALRLPLWPAQVFPFQRLPMVTMRAGHEKLALAALLISGRHAAGTFFRRRRDFQDFLAPGVDDGAGFKLLDRITTAIGIQRVV